MGDGSINNVELRNLVAFVRKLAIGFSFTLSLFLFLIPSLCILYICVCEPKHIHQKVVKLQFFAKKCINCQLSIIPQTLSHSMHARNIQIETISTKRSCTTSKLWWYINIVYGPIHRHMCVCVFAFFQPSFGILGILMYVVRGLH